MTLCPALDNDGDGYTVAQGDCNDNNSSIHPGAVDICGDGIDQDCTGSDCPIQTDAFLDVKNDFHITQRISIDGTYVGDVKPGQTVTFSISAGSHTLKACDNITGCLTKSMYIEAGGRGVWTIFDS